MHLNDSVTHCLREFESPIYNRGIKATFRRALSIFKTVADEVPVRILRLLVDVEMLSVGILSGER